MTIKTPALACLILLPLATSFLASASPGSAAPLTLTVPSSGEVTLTGDLWLPAGEGPFPVVVMTHGSEPGRRTAPAYRRWADAFRAAGVAILAFDKRGVGDSTGNYVEAPDLEVPAGDVIAWVELLKTRPEIRADSIGVLGWSQGGWVGPLAASRAEDLAFVISISGPGVSPLEQNIYDKTNQFRARGATDKQVQQFSEVIRRVWTYLVTGEGRAEAQAAWDAVAVKGWFEDGYNGPPMMDRDRLLQHPRMIDYVAHSSYDPAPVLARLQVPMLAVFGADDTIVPVARSIAAMKSAFARGGNDGLTIRSFPGGDHGIRVRGADGVQRLAPDLLKVVVSWVGQVTGTSPG